MGFRVDNKKIITSVAAWILIIGLLVFAGVSNADFFKASIGHIKDLSGLRIVLCLVLGNLYFVAEGMIIHLFTKAENNTLTLGQGMFCSYICAFYRVSTFGSATGIAQVYYYNKKGIDIPRGTGMSTAQYTFMKITVGLLGTVSFVALVLFGNDEVKKYSRYMLAGTIVIMLICLFLFVITVSKKLSDILVAVGYKLVKENGKLYAKLKQGEEAIANLQNCGRRMWHNKALLVKVITLNACKFACWYTIPGILLTQSCDVSIPVCFALMAITNMIGCVMVAPSGVGTLEFCAAIFFGMIIPGGEIIAAMIVMYRFFTWIIPFLIGIVPALSLVK